MDSFVFKGSKKLRKGVTTGTCAAAASAAAARMLLSGERSRNINVTLPGGNEIILEVESTEVLDTGVRCSIRKYAGDDPDITDGMLICSFAEAFRSSNDSPFGSKVIIEGGDGIGHVTRIGLDQPIGSAAINSVPRKMIEEAVLKEMLRTDFDGCLKVTISIPGGREAAARTFNPRLGIEGGLSVLGTTGIVEPMSDKAIVETFKLQLRQRYLEDGGYLVATPGNYGIDFIQKELGLDAEKAVMCSNFIGQAIDNACGIGAEGLLLCGHIGKMCKLASGIMNTHSKVADGRQEIFCCCALLAGSDRETAISMLDCATTEEAIAILRNKDLLYPFMDILMERIERRLSLRAGSEMKIAAVVFANDRKCLGKTSLADEMIQIIRNQQGKV